MHEIEPGVTAVTRQSVPNVLGDGRLTALVTELLPNSVALSIWKSNAGQRSITSATHKQTLTFASSSVLNINLKSFKPLGKKTGGKMSYFSFAGSNFRRAWKSTRVALSKEGTKY